MTINNTPRTSKAISTARSASIPGGFAEHIKAAGVCLGAAAALLSVIDILPTVERRTPPETCVSLAAGATRDLAAFVGSAA
ncbi:hypothetical protein IV454_16255 [Massilia antarctica]|uniref:Uncharacterized protein n=1 Tax=Massilia antarctica TaxID=2765360 RepID=A0AA48WKF4_9BURK|nr:hypothetical protein [Massilia antarctica]QPI52899.1 hypothetical protein IV454_16255 [Massilia antarctica]